MDSERTEELRALREQGEKLERELVALLERRAELAHRVRAVAEAAGQSGSESDEGAWLARLERHSTDANRDSLRPILREVRAAMRSIEELARVAYVGPEGGHCHQMALRHFGASAHAFECATVVDALTAVARGRAAFAVFPFESSAEGIAQSAVMELARSELFIVAERTLSVSYDLVAAPGVGVESIENLFVGAAALGSCESFVRGRLPEARVIETTSPKEALEHVREGTNAAALVPGGTLDLEGPAGEGALAIVESNVGDVADAFARFAVAGARPAKRAELNRTCLVFGVQDRPGALFEVLRHFAERGLNLGKVQSRPLPQSSLLSGPGWDYIFYAEVDGHETDRAMVTALDHVKRSAKFLRVLGSYPAEPPR